MEQQTDITALLEEQSLSTKTLSFDMSIGEIMSIYQNGELIIDPDFQRLFRWSREKQSQFIESLLLEFPIPPVFVIERNDGIYELIDGLQRITTVLRFFGVQEIEGENKWSLEGCDLVKELNGLSVNNLPLSERLKLKRTPLRMVVVKKNSNPHVKFEIFRRLNTGGEKLSDQEIRNCIMRIINNQFNEFIISSSRNTNYVRCIDSLSEERINQKYDQELVLRFFAFKNSRDDFRHDVGEFLTDFMRDVSEGQKQFDYNHERNVFEKTFLLLERILGNEIFCSYSRGRFVQQFRVNFYEAFTLGIQTVLNKWSDNPEEWDSELIERYKTCLIEIRVDSEFLKFTGAGSNTNRMLSGRIDFVAGKLVNLHE
ncbi:DUF262 domain-containing protein [Brevibacillus centrosporus]|uniref:GmrSD restriction endonucleases N-terminal domain-containing protein n=1 Tax=Brevibacillus centrosporus TaxID=54910 RepID=A0A1I3YE34_9BACL|nr:DUF262 domain-containing protein [Brevibacillus centrosporus]SFK29551.1 Protein of unknown function DUF262 [Brevibacillus centrosporus]